MSLIIVQKLDQAMTNLFSNISHWLTGFEIHPEESVSKTWT